MVTKNFVLLQTELDLSFLNISIHPWRGGEFALPTKRTRLKRVAPGFQLEQTKLPVGSTLLLFSILYVFLIILESSLNSHVSLLT